VRRSPSPYIELVPKTGFFSFDAYQLR
jgi:hypothetical protein